MNIEVRSKFRKTTNCSVGLLSIALMAAGFTPLLQGATPSTFTITPPLVEPIGIAYSPTVNKLLFTVPFFGKTNRKVIGVTDTGVSSLFATLPDRVTSPLHPDAWEDHIAVSPGLGGFTKGAVFATQGQDILQIPPTGGASVLFVHIPGLTDTHTGIAFDTVGTFGFQMLLTGQNSHVYSVNSAGVVTVINDITVFSAPVAVENGQVAPMGWGVYGGWFIIPSELTGHVVALNPVGSANMHQVVTLTALAPAPEDVRFVPSSPMNWGVSGGCYFYVVFETGGGTVVKFPASDFVPAIQGQALVPDEHDGTIRVVNSTTMGNPPVVSVFASGLLPQGADHEDSTFVVTPTVSTGCTLTQGGYKNHFNNLITPLVVGGVSYTAVQVNAILQNNAIQGNGALSLAHQLITAKLNVAGGASLPAAVATAIVQADLLLATTGPIPPVGNGFLSTSVTSTLETILDNYNSGITGPGHCQ